MFRVTIVLVIFLGLMTAIMGWVVTSDDSGQYFAASIANSVLLSNDYGTTWILSNPTYTMWSGITSDGSGKNLALSTLCNTSGECSVPYFSRDGGYTWTKGSGTSDYFYAISSDGTGDNLVAAGAINVYTSSDGGYHWSAADISPYTSGWTVAYSADGSTIVYTSSNYISLYRNGAWLGPTASPSAQWVGVGTDATGAVVAGCYAKGYYSNAGQDSGVYISTNGGSNYSPIVVTSTGEIFYSVSVTDDGSLVFYGGTNGLYVYNTATKTITHSDLPNNSSVFTVYSISTSKNGQYSIASTGANMWVSSNYGVNFTLSY